MRKRRTMVRRFLWLSTVAAIIGCGSEPDDRVFGTFVLVGVEGSTLPYLEASDADCDVFIAEGELTLRETGTYNLEFWGPYDCSRSGGSSGTIGRLYTGPYSQSGGALNFAAEIQGSGTLQFSGTVNPLESIVTVPPIPPQTGPDLTLVFQLAP
jgi:hypothetical protein